MRSRTTQGWPGVGRPERIAIVRATRLGDLLCAVPLFRALRRRWPEAHVTLVGLPWARAIVERYDAYLDGLLEFPGWPGIPERRPDPHRLNAFREKASEARFDLAIQAHGDGTRMNDFLDVLQAAMTAGFHPVDEPRPGPGFIPYPTDRHETLRLLALAGHLGAPEAPATLEFPLAQADRDEARELRGELGLLGRPYACLHPGSSTPARRWHAEGFARVADDLAEQGLDVVLTGTAGEVELADTVRRRARRAPLSAVGRTSLGGLGALIAEARVLVSNDTGVSHLAAALRVPSVVIFSGSDPLRWAPLGTGRHLVVGSGIPDDPASSTAGSIARPRPVPVGAVDVLLAVRRQLAVFPGVSA